MRDITADQLQADLDRLGSYAAVAREYDIPPTTLKKAGYRLGVRSPHARADGNAAGAASGHGAAISGDTATVTLPQHPQRAGLRTPDEVLRDHGLDPAEWEVASLNDNYWQGSDGEGPANLTQSKVVARRRVPSAMVLPARTDAPYRKRPARRLPTMATPTLGALPSDQHCPHQDPVLETLWLQWLRVNQPDWILGVGDIVNLAKPSRHRANLHAKHNDDPAECYQAAHDWWKHTLDAAGPNCTAGQLPGNHDLRAQIACMERLPELYDVSRPGEEHPWWDLEYMIGLDKLGVEFHRPEGEYHAAQVQIAKGLSVTHGSSAGPMGGAVKEMPRHESSRVVGHDHKQSITHVVRYRDGKPRLHVAVSVGTMARRDLGYTPNPDTEQGFGTVVVHADGTWNVELARFDARVGKLWWRDQVYSA